LKTKKHQFSFFVAGMSRYRRSAHAGSTGYGSSAVPPFPI